MVCGLVDRGKGLGSELWEWCNLISLFPFFFFFNLCFCSVDSQEDGLEGYCSSPLQKWLLA